MRPKAPKNRGRPGQDEDWKRVRSLLGFGDHVRAASEAVAGVQRNPKDPDMLAAAGAAMIRVRRLDQAEQYLEQSLKIRPVHARTLLDKANLRRSRGDIDGATECLDLALAYKPGYGAAIHGKVMLLVTHGRHDEAWALVEPQMKKRKPEPGVVACYASLSRAKKMPEKAVDALRPLLDRPDLGPARRREALFELGHALDALGEHSEAFDRFHDANALAKSEPDPMPGVMLERWIPERTAAIPRAELDASSRVLVVGMPRSSTSLTEQVVTMHPNAEGVGESIVLGQLGARNAPGLLGEGPGKDAPAPAPTPAEAQRLVNALGGAYLEHTAHAVGPDTTRVLDKMPGNDVWVGFADRVLPGARVVWCRRDPRDVVLSCFFQNFVGGIAFASDLRMCAERTVAHDRLMWHWTQTLEIQVIEHRYDAFVRDPEASTRTLLEFLGLEFDPACLRFFESTRRMDTASMSQVREPVFDRSLGRWRNYEAQLAPAIEILDAAGSLEGWES